LIKIDNHISLIKFPGFEYPHCNCLWIEDEMNCLLDTSPHEDDLRYLLNQRVDLIINSHGHIDHYLYNHLFPDARVMMHRGDSEFVQFPDKYTGEFGFEEFIKDPAVNRYYLKAVQYRTTRIDEFLEDGKIISLGSTAIKTIHIPGHSPGHCGFLFADKGFMFTSDIDLSTFGPWYANLNCSITALLNSIERILEIKPDYIVTGHGDGIVREGYIRRLKEYRDIIFARQKRIVDLISRGYNTIDEIAKKLPVYRQLPKPEIIFLLYEKVMILTHLRYLEETGNLIRKDNSYYLEENIKPALF